MNITNRLFAYPVLSNEKDDYMKSRFDVSYEYSMDSVNTLKLVFDINMSCPELERLIIAGQAEYVIHLECSTCAYRKVLSGPSSQFVERIPIGRINGTLDAVAFVISKKGIRDFECLDWDDDYSGMKFNISPGSILAYKNLDGIDVTKDYEEFTNAGSIITIYKLLTSENIPAEVSLDSAKIRIGLGSNDYDVYANYNTQVELQPIFNSMVILPVLVYVFEELKQDDGYETYHNREWFIALEKSYLKRGISLMDEVNDSEKTSFQLAQEALELSLSKAFVQIPMLYNSRDEEDV